MNLYCIRNWNLIYENNRSRKVIDLSWVPIRNRHDGENYTTVVTSENGSQIFSAFILMVQVASRCNPRGTLLRDNGQPHTSVSLSIKTRAPQDWFDLAFDFLVKNTDWLEVKDFPNGCQEGGIAVASRWQAGDEEQNRKKEQKERTESDSQSAFPKLEEVKAHAAFIGCPPLEAVNFFHHFDASGWVDKNSNPVKNWKSKLASWMVRARSMPSEAQHHAGNGQPKPEHPNTAAVRRQMEKEGK